MALNWIDVNEFSFNSFLHLERFQIRLICQTARANKTFRINLAAALRFNPPVLWYLSSRSSEDSEFLNEIVLEAESNTVPRRDAEVCVMSRVEDYIIYTRPELMDTHCNFICAWDKSMLLELADFNKKIVLDVGSGSGRLAFAAAEKALMVFASEPVTTLREYLRDKITREKIKNMAVVDGMAHALPYLDNSFDIVMSGHVVGDDYSGELKELERVVKHGGYILDCPGESRIKQERDGELVKMGFERLHYVSALGGDVYRHRKQIIK